MIILFDGICNLCNGLVNFIIDLDKKKVFKFAALQSEIGQQLKAKFKINESVDSIIFIKENTYLIKSEAVLEIIKYIPFLYFFRIFSFFPLQFNNKIYDFVAKNRYRLFKKRKTCRLPTNELKERFLE